MPAWRSTSHYVPEQTHVTNRNVASPTQTARHRFRFSIGDVLGISAAIPLSLASGVSIVLLPITLFGDWWEANFTQPVFAIVGDDLISPMVYFAASDSIPPILVCFSLCLAWGIADRRFFLFQGCFVPLAVLYCAHLIG